MGLEERLVCERLPRRWSRQAGGAKMQGRAWTVVRPTWGQPESLVAVCGLGFGVDPWGGRVWVRE